MATMSEIGSLDEINYKSPSKLKTFLVSVLGLILLMIGFLNYYPVGEAIKKVIRTQMAASGCNPDFNDLSINPFLLKVEVTELSLPSRCFNQSGKPLNLPFLTINYHLISFLPFGLPFRIDTQVEGNPLSIHFVAGIGEQMIRVKDQKLTLAKLLPLFAPQFKIAGDLTIDLSMSTNYQGIMTSMNLKAVSKNFTIPGQNVQGFELPNLRVGEIFVEASSENPPRIVIQKLIAGNPNSPIRANFKGRIDLQEGNPAFSPMEFVGEVNFSQSLKESVGILDLLMEPYPQRDGFYQVKIGGTLGAPRGSAP
jgi:type II secretion system protein N